MYHASAIRHRTRVIAVFTDYEINRVAQPGSASRVTVVPPSISSIQSSPVAGSLMSLRKKSKSSSGRASANSRILALSPASIVAEPVGLAAPHPAQAQELWPGLHQGFVQRNLF